MSTKLSYFYHMQKIQNISLSLEGKKKSHIHLSPLGMKKTEIEGKKYSAPQEHIFFSPTSVSSLDRNFHSDSVRIQNTCPHSTWHLSSNLSEKLLFFNQYKLYCPTEENNHTFTFRALWSQTQFCEHTTDRLQTGQGFVPWYPGVRIRIPYVTIPNSFT